MEKYLYTPKSLPQYYSMATNKQTSRNLKKKLAGQ